MNKEPETYEELIRIKRCYEFTNYYEVTEEELNNIYNFLTEHKDGKIKCTEEELTMLDNNEVINTMKVVCKATTIEGLEFSNMSFDKKYKQ